MSVTKYFGDLGVSPNATYLLDADTIQNSVTLVVFTYTGGTLSSDLESIEIETADGTTAGFTSGLSGAVLANTLNVADTESNLNTFFQNYVFNTLPDSIAEVKTEHGTPSSVDKWVKFYPTTNSNEYAMAVASAAYKDGTSAVLDRRVTNVNVQVAGTPTWNSSYALAATDFNELSRAKIGSGTGGSSAF